MAPKPEDEMSDLELVPELDTLEGRRPLGPLFETIVDDLGEDRSDPLELELMTPLDWPLFDTLEPLLLPGRFIPVPIFIFGPLVELVAEFPFIPVPIFIRGPVLPAVGDASAEDEVGFVLLIVNFPLPLMLALKEELSAD